MGKITYMWTRVSHEDLIRSLNLVISCSYFLSHDGLVAYFSNSVNLQRSKLATAELLSVAEKEGISIALVQEPYVGKTNVMKQSTGTKVIQCTLNRQKPVKAAVVELVHRVICDGKTAALILARGGSKGVPLKNIQKVGELSILVRTIQTARIAGVSDITVSTDHPAIALEAIRSGVKVFHRSKITATDTAPSIWGVQELLHSRSDLEVVLLLQATSPFTQPIHIREALTKIEKFDCVFSVTRIHKLRWVETNGLVYPSNFKLDARPRRQSWNGELIETGAFYTSRKHLIERGYFQNHK